MQKLSNQSKDISQENIKKVEELFPNCVTETYDQDGNLVRSIDFDILRQDLSDHVVEGPKERYQFNWPGKREAILLANAPTSNTLRPLPEKSVDFENTKNVYIEGDNLEALKILRETYMGKIKMIYIDPPYNTGNDFVYKDDFKESTEDYLKSSGNIDEEGNRMAVNGESNGRFHSDWLNMMYPRLILARDLLTDDGAIFISIDDNEVVNLRKICDDVFGKENYVNQFVWVSNLTGRQISGFGAAKTYEYILCYCKDSKLCGDFTIDANTAKKLMPDTYKSIYRNVCQDKKGSYSIGDTLYNHNRIFNEESRPNLVFSIFYNPDTGDIVPGNIGQKIDGYIEILPHKNNDGIHKYHAWRWSKPKIEAEKEDLIVLTTTSGFEVHTKIRDFAKTSLKDLITNISNGEPEVRKLFDSKNKIFSYPKSVDLLKVLIKALDEKDGYFLDFFSGSGTTAHAILELNKEDQGTRKFIMVQLPEICSENSDAFKAGYQTICDIGEDRIRRAGRTFKDENPLTAMDLDIGFRVYKTDSSNMKDVQSTPQNTQISLLENADSAIKVDRTPLDLVIQVMLQLGITLDANIKKGRCSDGAVYYLVNNNDLLCCFDKAISESDIEEMAKLQPLNVAFSDDSFASDQDEVNCEQIFKTLSPITGKNIFVL